MEYYILKITVKTGLLSESQNALPERLGVYKCFEYPRYFAGTT